MFYSTITAFRVFKNFTAMNSKQSFSQKWLVHGCVCAIGLYSVVSRSRPHIFLCLRKTKWKLHRASLLLKWICRLYFRCFALAVAFSCCFLLVYMLFNLVFPPHTHTHIQGTVKRGDIIIREMRKTRARPCTFQLKTIFFFCGFSFALFCCVLPSAC